MMALHYVAQNIVTYGPQDNAGSVNYWMVTTLVIAYVSIKLMATFIWLVRHAAGLHHTRR